jgi:hypothetical protein
VARIWKSELRLDLRIGGCVAELRGPGWKRRLVASASAVGTGAAAISGAIKALQLVDDGVLLPSDARLTVADEYVCYALLDAQVSTQHALDEATLQFSTALGREDLVVQVSALPAGNGWLAAAVLETDLHDWADALADEGVRLEHVHPALAPDLSRIAAHVREDDAAIALLRDSGATLVRLEHGVPAALAWEPFDVNDRGALDRRLQTFVHNTSPGPLERMGRRDVQQSSSVAIYLYTGSKTLSLYSAAGRDEVLMGPRRRRPVTRPAVDELGRTQREAGGRDAADRHDALQPASRRMPPADRAAPVASRAQEAARSVHSPGPVPRKTTLAQRENHIELDSTLELPEATKPRRPTTGSSGAAALAALASTLRQALNRSRARRNERRRIEAELNAEPEPGRKDFSPTGSVVPDVWQDTVQAAEEEAKAVAALKVARAADTARAAPRKPLDDRRELLAAIETERALELAFMREDELPASAWRAGTATGPAPAPAAATPERRRPVPATLVWPPPTLEVGAMSDAAEQPLAPGVGQRQPQQAPGAISTTDPVRTAGPAGEYEGVDRRRSHRA